MDLDPLRRELSEANVTHYQVIVEELRLLELYLLEVPLSVDRSLVVSFTFGLLRRLSRPF